MIGAISSKCFSLDQLCSEDIFLPVSSYINNCCWELSLNIVLKVLCFQHTGFLIQVIPLLIPMIAIVWRQFEMTDLGEESLPESSLCHPLPNFINLITCCDSYFLHLGLAAIWGTYIVFSSPAGPQITRF